MLDDHHVNSSRLISVEKKQGSSWMFFMAKKSNARATSKRGLQALLPQEAETQRIHLLHLWWPFSFPYIFVPITEKEGQQFAASTSRATAWIKKNAQHNLDSNGNREEKNKTVPKINTWIL